MPRIFQANNLILSDEVFTISDDEFDTDRPLEVLELPEDDQFEEPEGEPGPEDQDTVSARLSQAAAEQILQQAREEASRIVNQATLQAQLDHDHLLAQTAAELEQIKQRAYDEAFEHGRADGARTQVEDVKDAIAAMELNIAKLEGEQAGFMAEYEYNLKWLAWEIASKVLGRKIEEDETEMLSLVKTAVSSVKNAQWITVEISDKMTKLIDLLTRTVRKSGEERIDVRGITAPTGTCIIDTPDGLVDASVYKQLENLRIYFSQDEE